MAWFLHIDDSDANNKYCEIDTDNNKMNTVLLWDNCSDVDTHCFETCGSDGPIIADFKMNHCISEERKH